MWNPLKVIMYSFRQLALNPPLRVLAASFVRLRVRSTLFGSASLHLLFRYLVPLSPRGLRRFAAALRLRSTFILSLAAGMVSLVLSAACKTDFIFIRLQRAWLFFTTSCSQQGSGGVCNPANPPPLVGTAYKRLCFAHAGV